MMWKLPYLDGVARAPLGLHGHRQLGAADERFGALGRHALLRRRHVGARHAARIHRLCVPRCAPGMVLRKVAHRGWVADVPAAAQGGGRAGDTVCGLNYGHGARHGLQFGITLGLSSAHRGFPKVGFAVGLAVGFGGSCAASCSGKSAKSSQRFWQSESIHLGNLRPRTSALKLVRLDRTHQVRNSSGSVGSIGLQSPQLGSP